MSQIETLMVLALGSALTFVFFLLFGRVFWNLAMSAGARRNAKHVPVEMLELQADRDRLRAEHALMARKLELRLEDIKSRMTEQMAEVSRNRNRVQGLLLDMQKQDDTLNARERELVQLNTQLDMYKSDLAASNQTIENLVGEAHRKDEDTAKLQDAFRQLSATLREKNALVGNLNEELRSALNANQSGADDHPHAPESRLRQRVAELTSISADMSREHEAPQASAPEPTPIAASTMRQLDLQNKLNQTEREADAMAAELEQLDQMLAAGGVSNKVVPASPPKKSGAMANVISLAQRIRALQQGMND